MPDHVRRFLRVNLSTGEIKTESVDEQVVGREQDTLPQRIRTEPLHTGEGEIVRHMDEFLDRYYQLRGWTKQGIPSPKKLKQLNLDYAVKDIG